MSPLVRNAIAVVAGAVAGLAVIMVAQFINSTIFPPPPGVDVSDPAGMARVVREMPTGAFAGLVLGYLLGTTAGAYVAVRLAASRHLLVAYLVALLFIAGGVANFTMIPHPIWVPPVSMLAFFAAPIIALRLARDTVAR